MWSGRESLNNYLIISPAYNIEKFAQSHVELLNQFAEDIDYLIIDDCSTDQTHSIISELTKSIVRLDSRSGKAKALDYGFNYAMKNKYDAVITIDSDFQHDHSYIKDFINTFENSDADYLIGRRHFSLFTMPTSRILSNSISSFILSRLSGTKLYDSQCGFRMIHKRYLDLNIASDGFQYESEHIAKSVWMGAKVEHIRIPTIYNGALSSMKYVKDTFKFIKLFIHLAWNRKVLMQSFVKEQV